MRLNPAPAYLIAVSPTLAANPDLPDNAPNVPPPNWADPAAYCVPESVPDEVYQLAAVWEMADRTYYGRWYHVFLALVQRAN